MASEFVKLYRTPKGLLYYRYRDARARVNGKPLRSGMARVPENQPWLGLPLASRVEFVEWSLNDPGFWKQYNAWVASGYQRKYAPTLHRVDRRRAEEGGAGYVTSNIQWRENLEKTREHLAEGKKTREAKKLTQT